MKAILLKAPGGLDNIRIGDIEDPGAPGRNEIRVTIKAHSLNYHDLLVAQGAIPVDDNRVLFSDGAGIVEAVGEDVHEFAVGDSVVSTFFPLWSAGPPNKMASGFRYVPGDGLDGLGAQHVVRDANAFTKAPAGWTHVQSATITTSALTAWRGLVVEGKLKAGDVVLTQGTGGVSIAAIQIAKAMGATVIATSSSDEKLKKAAELGADHLVNYVEHPQWGKEALKITDGRGVDHVVDVGGPATLNQSVTALKVGGHIALIGVLTGMAGDFSLIHAVGKQARMSAVIVGNREQQQDFVRALETTRFDPCVDKVFGVSDTREAFEYQISAKHFGKICVQW